MKVIGILLLILGVAGLVYCADLNMFSGSVIGIIGGIGSVTALLSGIGFLLSKNHKKNE